jgi:hypothetical protein
MAYLVWCRLRPIVARPQKFRWPIADYVPVAGKDGREQLAKPAR